ncbi:hypothetical protein NM208_g9835 [Fusarium decemcellulare]|uniref:Uncharacterized protein n=1 Tax=Fusarium decemcellulare TaxID=57161 RepID=A0ACC1S062_9HYPO|nr:hypothetical protein NM208_g9835 [Fusarium decemcellulare]
MLLVTYFVGLFLIPPVRADGWDDFSNNLATDLAPFLSLFGEQITKQYLSESITLLDNFIFAMAPMGILTAVVSAIRVCGSPSLRAFIGRAQEGSGNAEAELCSSTSRDVCELYNNGGITRVFGRPKILEIVFDPDDPDFKNTAGIYTFQKYLESENGRKEWHELREYEPDLEKTDTFAPNLSLNVGIKRRPPLVFWAVAAIGLVLQAGVLAFAVVATYVLKWDKDGNQPETYACPLVIVGTVMVCCGSFLCAFLIGQSTDEQLFRRKMTGENRRASVYWIQPGGQTLGDQVFDPFCYSDHAKPLDEYITSWKNPSEDWSNRSGLVVWVAVGTTVSGFVLQFVGLRGIHSAVSVAQLGAILVMSMARAALRMQRLSPASNYLRDRPDEVVGHELDWLALRIGEPPGHLWNFCGPAGVSQECPPTPSNLDTAAKLLLYRTRLAELTQSPTSHTKAARSAAYFDVDMIEVRESAVRLALAMESAVSVIYARSPKIQDKWENATSMYCSFICSTFDALEKLLQSDPTRSKCTPTSLTRSTFHLELTRESPDSPWTLQNRLELEGLLGLWVWSLKSDPLTEIADRRNKQILSRAGGIPARRIVTTNPHITDSDLKIWFGTMAPTFIQDELSRTSNDCCNASTIWEQDQNRRLHNTSGAKYKTLSHGLPEHLEHVVRFFGWPATELPQSTCSGSLKCWSAPTKSSLLSLCTQEVFKSFVKCILSLVADFGGIHPAKETQHFRPENSLASDLTSLFIESRLGSREDASLCILPPFIPHLMRSSAGSALAAARKSADQHRKHNQWDQAGKVLRWAWGHCRDCSISDPISGEPLSHSHSQEAATALGELYRWALRDDTARGFGIDGISWLSHQPLSGAVEEIVSRYKFIAETISRQTAPVSGQGEPGSDVGHTLTATLLYLTQSISTTANEKGKLLCSAAKHGWMEVVLALLESGAELDFRDTESRTALSYAAEGGNADVAKELLDRGAFPNFTDGKHRTPLSYASEKGCNELVKALLSDQRVEPNVLDKRERSPLWWAAYKGHESVVKLLLDRRAAINKSDYWGQTPLGAAAEKGHESVVKLLLDRGAPAGNISGKDSWSPFAMAAAGGHESVGQTLLRLAAANGHEDVLKPLLDKGADITTTSHNRRTPLDGAEEGGYSDQATTATRALAAHFTPDSHFLVAARECVLDKIMFLN